MIEDLTRRDFHDAEIDRIIFHRDSLIMEYRLIDGEILIACFNRVALHVFITNNTQNVINKINCVEYSQDKLNHILLQFGIKQQEILYPSIDPSSDSSYFIIYSDAISGGDFIVMCESVTVKSTQAAA